MINVVAGACPYPQRLNQLLQSIFHLSTKPTKD